MTYLKTYLPSNLASFEKGRCTIKDKRMVKIFLFSSQNYLFYANVFRKINTFIFLGAWSFLLDPHLVST
jgi:hypothetical protein